MNTTLDSFSGLGKFAVRGIINVSAPSIVKGFLVEILHQDGFYKGRKRKIDVKLLTELVNENAGLWDLFPPQLCIKTKNVMAQVDNKDWFTAVWVIEAIKGDHPVLASLFLGWRKAFNWLERQIEEIKRETG